MSYALSGLLLAATPVTDPPPRTVTRSVLADLREGARWVYRHPTLRPLALSTHGWFLFNAVLITAYVPYALLELSIGAAGLGVTFALAGIGALLGSSASETLSRRAGIPATVAGSRMLEAGGIAVVTAAAGTDGGAIVVVAAAGQFLYGLGLGAEGPIEMSYRQSVTPDRLQGRMNATMRSLNRAAVVVGGLFADAVGLRPAHWARSSGRRSRGRPAGRVRLPDSLQRQAAVAKAVRARAEEDARGPVYTDEQEAALMAARHRRAIAALDEQ